MMNSATSALPKAINSSIDDPAALLSPVGLLARATPSVPFQSADAPDVGEPDAEHRHEGGHLPEPHPAEATEDDRPGIHEHHLDVEDHEQDRDEVELDREPHAADRADRRVAGLEDLELGLRLPLRAQQPARAHHDRSDERAEREADQQSDVGIRHAAALEGLGGMRRKTVRRLEIPFAKSNCLG